MTLWKPCKARERGSWRAQRTAADDQRAGLETRISHLSLQVQKQSEQVSELTQQLQLTQKLQEKRSLQERQAVPAADHSQVGCSQALRECSMDGGSWEGFAWRRLPPHNASGSPQGRKGQSNATAAASGSKGHKLAVLVPYRDRPSQLDTMLPALDAYLQRQQRYFTIFVLEQTAELRFNRGALLNAGFLLLGGSDYDHFAFQDVDTVPTEAGNIQYEYPMGAAPLHLTPNGIHPNARYEEFFGGIVVFTREQMAAVNGFGVNFWGWGREDDNMRLRLMAAQRWPPQQPRVPLKRRNFYFHHSRHEKAPEVRLRARTDGTQEVVEEHPDLPYDGASIISSQAAVLHEQTTGLNNTQFVVQSMSPHASAVKFTLQLWCNHSEIFWCG